MVRPKFLNLSSEREDGATINTLQRCHEESQLALTKFNESTKALRQRSIVLEDKVFSHSDSRNIFTVSSEFCRNYSRKLAVCRAEKARHLDCLKNEVQDRFCSLLIG